MLRRFMAVFYARSLEFFRDKGTLFWNMFFPLLLIFGFAFTFSGQQVLYKIGYTGELDPSIEFTSYQYLDFIPYQSQEQALDKLSHHQLDMVIDFTRQNYWINEQAANGYIVEKMLLSDREQALQRNLVSGRAIRYVDWVVPGVLSMNIMFSCLMGVGFVIVRYRKNNVLKRFNATPLTSLEFVIAQVCSRFLIVLFVTALLFVGTNFFLNFMMKGSYFDLFIVTACAVFSLISLGLLLASRFKTEELAGGIINVVAWPMMFFSGVWFSLEGTPDILQNIANVFPLTHFLVAARAIMLDGASLADVWQNVLILILMSVSFLVLASLLFKWKES